MPPSVIDGCASIVSIRCWTFANGRLCSNVRLPSCALPGLPYCKLLKDGLGTLEGFFLERQHRLIPLQYSLAVSCAHECCDSDIERCEPSSVAIESFVIEFGELFWCLLDRSTVFSNRLTSDGLKVYNRSAIPFETCMSTACAIEQFVLPAIFAQVTNEIYLICEVDQVELCLRLL